MKLHITRSYTDELYSCNSVISYTVDEISVNGIF